MVLLKIVSPFGAIYKRGIYATIFINNVLKTLKSFLFYSMGEAKRWL